MPRSAVARASQGHAIFDEIHSYCLSHADEARAQRYARFFTEGYNAYGIDPKDPEWEPARLRWSARFRELGPQAFMACADRLVRTGKYEEAGFAILIASDLSEFDSRDMFAAIGGWFDCGGICNWALTDTLCKMVTSRYLSNNVVGLTDLTPWRNASYPYKRRAVPVTLVEAIDKRDLKRWLPFLEPLMTDDQKVVRQGMGWFLREAWKREPERVEPFLLKWKDTAPRLIYQYATEKMTAAERARFRRSR
jgi:hypothetical protein